MLGTCLIFHFVSFTFRFSSCLCPILDPFSLEIFRLAADGNLYFLLCLFTINKVNFWFYFWERRGQDLILSPTSEKKGHLMCILGIDVFRWRTG
ncbi:hypothetical protein HDV64DRAFT_3984 [Trichoderma sp. TUCIM 5745]